MIILINNLIAIEYEWSRNEHIMIIILNAHLWVIESLNDQ